MSKNKMEKFNQKMRKNSNNVIMKRPNLFTKIGRLLYLPPHREAQTFGESPLPFSCPRSLCMTPYGICISQKQNLAMDFMKSSSESFNIQLQTKHLYDF